MGKAEAVVGRAEVYCGEELAGHIERTATGSSFRYDGRFLESRGGRSRGIACCLPLRSEPYLTQGMSAHPFFAGLLPEGPRRGALASHLATSEDDVLSLVAAAGSDCVGDVSVVREGQVPEPAPPLLDATSLDSASFDELWEASLDYGPTGRPDRATAAGAQRKLSAAPLVATGSGRAYFLKLAPPGRPRLVENEHFFMSMARACGLEAARVELAHDRHGQPGLLVERFDRLADAHGLPRRRVSQQDGCQLLGRPPEDKHVVTAEHLAEGMGLCDKPALAVARLVEQVAFAYLIGNGELHGRDVSVRTSPETGLLGPAPVYDMLSTLPLGESTMTLCLDGRDSGLEARHFVALGAEHGLRASATEAVLSTLCERAERWIDRVDEIGYGKRKSAYLRETMTRRRKALTP